MHYVSTQLPSCFAIRWDLGPTKIDIESGKNVYIAKIVREYDQEIPQSQTADKPVSSKGRAIQQSRDTRKTNKVKQPTLSSPSR